MFGLRQKKKKKKQLLAHDQEWLCLATHCCQLCGGFRTYLAGFTSHCGRRSEGTELVTAAQL